MTDVSPAKIGLLFDYIGEGGTYDENVLPSLQLVADDFLARGILERPVEFVVRHVQGLPNELTGGALAIQLSVRAGRGESGFSECDAVFTAAGHQLQQRGLTVSQCASHPAAGDYTANSGQRQRGEGRAHYQDRLQFPLLSA